MSRFDEENSTVRWIPGFARGWFGLTGEEPRSRRDETRADARVAADNSLLPLAVRKFFGLTFDEPSSGGARGPIAAEAVRDEPRGEVAGTRYAPSPSGNFGGTSGYVSPSLGSDKRTPVAGMGDLQPLDYLLRAYARGALPPQGLETFTRQVRHTGEDVIGFYTKWINFQTEGLIKIGGDILSTVVDALPGERSTTAATPMRRIKVTAADDNGNGNGHGGDGADK
jgi:hypothetical protein